MPLTGVINYVFCIYICCFIANFCHRTRWGSKQSHSHRAYIVIFSFLFTWPLKPDHKLIPILTFRVTQCHDLDHSGSRDVIGHVTFESQWAISYWWSIGPKSLSPAVQGVPRRQPHRRSGLATLPSVGAVP